MQKLLLSTPFPAIDSRADETEWTERANRPPHQATPARVRLPGSSFAGRLIAILVGIAPLCSRVASGLVAEELLERSGERRCLDVVRLPRDQAM